MTQLAFLSEEDTVRSRMPDNAASTITTSIDAQMEVLRLPGQGWLSAPFYLPHDLILTAFMLTNLDTVQPEQVEAEWKKTVEAQVDELTMLPAGWDSYAAPPIEPGVAADAKVLLAQLAKPMMPVPAVVPTVNGTIQFEWHTKSSDVEVEVLEPKRYYVFTRSNSAPPWEGEATLNETLSRLEALLAK